MASGSVAAITSSSISLCATSAALTTWFVPAKYSSNGSCGLGATSTGVEERYLFRSFNATSSSGVHSIGPTFFKILKKGEGALGGLGDEPAHGGNATSKP